MCRTRVSNWARKKAREGKLVDEARWNVIQKLFPERSKRRLRGEDGCDLEITEFSRVVAKSGELRKEYEEELLKIRLEKEEESRASEEIARQLEEEELQIEEQLQEDKNIAEKLQIQEIEEAGGKICSLNSKLRKFINVDQLPKERPLRSKTADRSKLESVDKPRASTSLTNWLSKACHGLPGSHTDDFQSNTAESIQEREDYQLAAKLQKEINADCRKLWSTSSRRNTYPLRQRKLVGSVLSAKRLKPSGK